MSLNNIHAEWLSLVDISGPFLAIPVLTHTFPQGLEELSSFKRRRLRQAYDEWREALEQEDSLLEELHSAWIDEVLSRVLAFDDDGKGDVLKRAEWCGSHLKSLLPDQGVVQYPDLAVVDEQQNNKPLLLIHTYKPNVDLESTVKQEGWVTTPADRMVQLCRSLDCRLGLVTNGERWMLVDAPVGAVTSFSSWYARLWSLEPITLQAFVHLLGIRRFFVDETEQLPALFDASLKYQDEVTDALGEQVCRAVEVLIQSLDKADQDRNRELLCDVSESELYEAALTVMMRLVFLLSAEERGLLLLGDECYESNYAISTLRMQLRQEPSEILERRWDAWTRLLATFRAVYCGVEHENLRLPALGSSLFDPDHFPFLEGRAKGSTWQTNTAIPLPIDNRTVLLLLDSLQQFQGRTLSYRALDVEQIGYVYEGLLERTVKRTNEVTLQLDVTKKAKSQWVKLAELESASIDGHDSLVKFLQECSGISVSRIRKDLRKEVDSTLTERLLITCQGDIKLRDRLKPFAHLLRTDPWGYPLVYPAGAFIVTSGSNRRETGTHYTPKSLTEAIVAETLIPLAYIGPIEGTLRERWRLRSAAELLDLKICDPAMGSGAFLVQVCRWLADRLVEAWVLAEATGKVISADGTVQKESYKEELLPRDVDTRIIIARSLIAERCLYGVDLNPLAVELAKLSIWLVTLAKGRPFGYLDHNLRCGDSLLGIQRLEQLIQLSMNPTSEEQLCLFGQNIKEAVYKAIALRQRLSELPINSVRDVETMAHFNTGASNWLELPKHIANIFVGKLFEANGNSEDLKIALAMLAIQADKIIKDVHASFRQIQDMPSELLSANLFYDKPLNKYFHWPLEFPEVFLRENGGFDSIVGNPPFLGGQRITGVTSTMFRDWLVAYIAEGRRGSADLSAYFFLRAWALLRKGGNFGLIAVNTIAEGDTRQVGLEAMVSAGAVIYSAYPNEPWPGKAAVITSRVHVHKGEWQGERFLIGRKVPFISAFLSDQEEWSPKRLKANEGNSFIGSYVLGMGFVLTSEEAQSMLDADPKNTDVIFPYINGEDLNTDPEQKPSRWVINFWDWPEERAKEYKLPWQWIEERVKPERQRKNERGEFVLRKPLPERWWQYSEKRPALYHAIGRGEHFHLHPKNWVINSRQKQRIFCLSRVSKYLAPAVTPPNYVWSDSLVIFRSDSFIFLGILLSQIHEVWVRKNSSRLESRLRYTPSDALDTLPFPDILPVKLGDLAKEFMDVRAKVCLEEKMGVTDAYNRLHTNIEQNIHIERLRVLQREIDIVTAQAYGWEDLDLEHDFHEVSYLPEHDRVRFTISEVARVEVLQRLSELNRLRYQDEAAADKLSKS